MKISLEDARQRWRESVVVIGGEPVYVKEVAGTRDSKTPFAISGLRITPSDSWDMQEMRVSFTDVKEVLPTLGNIQLGESAHRLTRKVTRQYSRGLVPGQISSTLIGVHGSILLDVRNIPSYDASCRIVSPQVIRAIYSGAYIPFMEALRRVASASAYSVAVSKDLALAVGASRWPLLFYKIHPVGKVEGDVVMLEKSAACLRELVQNHVPIHVAVR